MSHTISLEINGRVLSIELGKIAKQADGSAVVRYGDTMMFVSATSRKEAKEDKDFLPLIVDYRENTYAAGKIPGGFFKRLIDRPIRPLFPEGYFNDTQVVALLLSADLENEPDTLGIIGASAALYFSDIPFTKPIGAVKVGLINDRYVVNPTAKELDQSALNLLVVGTEDGVCMLEAGAKEVDEEKMLGAIAAALEPIRRIIEIQKEGYREFGPKKREFAPKLPDQAKLDEIEARIGPALLAAFQTPGKKNSENAVAEIQKNLITAIPEEDKDGRAEAKALFARIEEKLARKLILEQGVRVDGRTFDQIRPISAEVGLLPRTHGSALFTRGETQCLATVTLGTPQDVQRIDGLGEETHKRFMLHYNFPSFSVGEVGFLRGPGRREIGHGALAEKSILQAMPDEEKFPYTVRIVSDIMESNGSSSMATVCGGILALMDAGVPLTMIVAGIAIGLVEEGDRHAVLTDIAGLEDHFGDMDFKVAGTERGITAVQMDLKIQAITLDLVREALGKAKAARLQVLEKMKAVIASPRPDISPFAPHIYTMFVNPEKVGEVIGPSGKVIKRIVAATKAKIDIDETGKITIASTDMEAAEKAKQMISEITAEAEIGRTYTGKVVLIEEYGAFVEILPNLVGLMHVSEIAHQRTANVRDVLSIGQTINVKVLNVEDGGKIKLSMKALIENPNPDGDRAPEGGANRDQDSRYQRPPGGGRGGDHRRNRH